MAIPPALREDRWPPPRPTRPSAKTAGRLRHPPRRTACNLDNLFIAGIDEAKLADAWQAVHRLLRLVERTGWSIRDADVVVTALGGIHVEPLGDVVYLHEGALSRTPLRELAALWAAVEIRASVDRPSLYAELFLTTSVAGPPPKSLALTGSGEPVGPGDLPSHRDHLLAALRMTAADFLLVTDGSESGAQLRLAPALADTDLTLANSRACSAWPSCRAARA